MNTNKALLVETKMAIKRLFSDTTVPTAKTMDNLEELREEIETLIENLKMNSQTRIPTIKTDKE